MKTRKSNYWLLIWVIGLLALSACSNESSDSQPATSVSYVTQLPASLLVRPADTTLKAYIAIDGGTRVEVPLDVDENFTYSTRLTRAEHTVVITYEVTDNTSGDVILAATASRTVDLAAGDDEIVIAEAEYDFGPCVLDTSLIGGCAL